MPVVYSKAMNKHILSLYDQPMQKQKKRAQTIVFLRETGHVLEFVWLNADFVKVWIMWEQGHDVNEQHGKYISS